MFQDIEDCVMDLFVENLRQKGCYLIEILFSYMRTRFSQMNISMSRLNIKRDSYAFQDVLGKTNFEAQIYLMKENPQNIDLNECYAMTESSVTLIGHMSVARSGAASLVIDDNMLWVTGGMLVSPPDTDLLLSSTEFITKDGKSLPGPDLPMAMMEHTIVSINASTSILIGRYIN